MTRGELKRMAARMSVERGYMTQEHADERLRRDRDVLREEAEKAERARYDDRGRWSDPLSPTVVGLEARHRPGTLACWDVWELHADGAERVHMAQVTGVGAMRYARQINRGLQRRREKAARAKA